MTAQAPGFQRPFSDQQTPVIIKIGSGDVPASTGLSDSVPVEIESLFMPFEDPVPEAPTWETAQSTSTGRIIELTIVVNNLPRVDVPVTPSNELVTARIEFGAIELVLMESGAPPQEVFFTLTSIGVPFSVTPGENWTTAAANFPPVTRVIFMQGATVLHDQHFESTDNVSLNIQFFES